MPAGALARAMPEREFNDWQRYAARRMLPQRRIEMYLAQIAMLIAKTNGGASGKGLDDFMLDPPPDDPDEPEDDLAAAVEFFGFRPRNTPKD
jgi:hypothetical protein